MTRTITTPSKVDFIIDVEDYEEVTKYKWKCDTTGYIRRMVWFDNSTKCRTLALHRFLLDAPDDKLVDHINGIITDNRKCNLRLATKTDNCRNRKTPKTNTSGYKGVSYRKDSKNWKAQIPVNGKRVNLGHFDNKHDAARMYNFWAKDIFGEFARLNEIREGDEDESYNNH